MCLTLSRSLIMALTVRPARSSPRSLSFRVPSRLTGHHSSFRGKEPAPREPIGRRPRSRRRPVTTTGDDARPNGDDDARRTVSVSFAPASRVRASRSRVARRPRVAGGAIRADKTAGSRANRGDDRSASGGSGDHSRWGSRGGDTSRFFCYVFSSSRRPLGIRSFRLGRTRSTTRSLADG